MILVIALSSLLRSLLGGAAAVALENLALRHQLMVLQRSVGRPRLAPWDRALWVWLSRVWPGWRSRLVIVQPATVLAWHRQGFRLYWRWRSNAHAVGRPPLDAELRQLIRRMARENPTWGRRRIQAELALLGYEVGELTVTKYMQRASPRPSPTWRTFLVAHAREMVAVDYFLVPTLTFRLLFVFIVLRHDRRELLHVNLTDHPQPSGPAGSSSRRSRIIRLRATSSVIVTASMVMSSCGASKPWGFAKSSSPHARPGRIPSWSGSSARSAASASTTSSC
jgi:putative transposase